MSGINMATLVQQSQAPKRVQRAPSFPMAGTLKPFGLYPLMCHPVLPGETLHSFQCKMRNISMPLENPLGGAWLETWLVFVKLTDIDPDLAQTFVKDNIPTTGYVAGSDKPRMFTKSGQIDWVSRCVKKFYQSYLVHETDPNYDSRVIDGVPMVKLNNESWYQNLAFKETDVTVPTGDASDLYAHLQEYQILQQMGLVEMTYEKYVQQYGGQMPRETEGDPEILKFWKSWTQPVNHVESSTGVPTSSWVWKDQMSMTESKRFNEPGFLLLIQTCRPKMFNAKLTSSMIGELWGFSDWYPIYTVMDPTAGIKSIQSDATVFDSTFRTDVPPAELIYDHRDLLAHGEQFINDFTNNPYPHNLHSGMSGNDADETELIRGEYPQVADCDALFQGTANRVYYEGIAFAKISGHVQDTTPMR